MNHQEWNTMYAGIMAIVSVVFGATSVALALLTLRRPASSVASLGSRESPTMLQSLSVLVPKVHYQDSQYLVAVRKPGEWHELREFVKPLDPKVQEIYRQVGPDRWALLDWVCHNIGYRSDDGEWWSFPGETIGRRTGDCDDSSILTCSLLRNFSDCFVVAGTYRGYGHAWVQTDDEILETTYSSARPVTDPEQYRPHVMFNDREVIEFWPEALSGLFQLAKNECQKLSLMSEALNGK